MKGWSRVAVMAVIIFLRKRFRVILQLFYDWHSTRQAYCAAVGNIVKIIKLYLQRNTVAYNGTVRYTIPK